MKLRLLLFLVLLSISSLLNAVTWEIKQDGTGDFITIQEGIDASFDNYTVLVYPGTYYENLNFNGKNIKIGSLMLTTGDESYIHTTIIDGTQNGSVVVFENDENDSALLIGFTIQNGNGYEGKYGGGIFINYSSPSLKYLIIENNFAGFGGGIYFSSSRAYLEAVTIRNNHAASSAGGITIMRKPPNPIASYITFSSDNRCNIYNNTAGFAADIYIQDNQTQVTDIYLDTLTVSNPDWNFVSQFPNINLEIQNKWLQQIEADLYVNPNGNDNNSGLLESEPLKTIQWALTKIKADSLHPHKIYLAEGVYSPTTNGEYFALNMRSYVDLIGAGIDQTIMEEPLGGGGFISSKYTNDVFSISGFTLRNRTGTDLSYPAIYLSDCDSELSYIKIENCEYVSSAAISCYNSNIIMDNIQVLNNRGRQAVSISAFGMEKNATITNSIFIGSDQYEPCWGGRALSVYRMHTVEIINCLFENNYASANTGPFGNILLKKNDTLNFYNNTVVNNIGNGGAIYHGGGGEVNIKNSIVYGNISYQFMTIGADEPTTVNISHSLIEGGTDPSIINVGGGAYGVEFVWGEGIIDEVPQFVGGEDEYDPLYYQLAENSPCVDAGVQDTTGLFIPSWDLLGNERVIDGNNDGIATIDIGCYEFTYLAAPMNLEVDETTGTIFWEAMPNFYPTSFNIYLDTFLNSVVGNEQTEFTFSELIEDEIYLAGISANYENGESAIIEIAFTYSTTSTEEIIIPKIVTLQNYPNPFNPETRIAFSLVESGDVILEIFNIKGQKVKTLIDAYMSPGGGEIIWNGRDENNKRVASGVYFYLLKTPSKTITKKCLLLK